MIEVATTYDKYFVGWTNSNDEGSLTDDKALE